MLLLRGYLIRVAYVLSLLAVASSASGGDRADGSPSVGFPEVGSRGDGECPGEGDWLPPLLLLSICSKRSSGAGMEYTSARA